jgi:hypothetical protein
MLARAFVEIRWLAWEGHNQQAGDLADIFHNLPVEMYGIGGWNWPFLREDLARYQQKYDVAGYYVEMLDEIMAQG